MWIPLKGGLALIKKLGGGKEGFKKALKQNPKLFKKTGKRTTTKLDNRTGKPVSGPAPKKSNAWGRLPESIRKKLLAGNTKGMSPEQVAKYRTVYKNRNK